MNLQLYVPGALSVDEITEWLMEYRRTYPEICHEIDLNARARKLQSLATVILARNEMDEPLGFLFFYSNATDKRTAFITSIAKLRREQSGVGTALHHSYVEYVSRLGFSASRLEVAKSNIRAKAFYRKLGYVVERETAESLVMKMEVRT